MRLVTGTADGLIVPASRMGPGHWTPDAAAVAAFEGGLPAFLQRARPDAKPDLYKSLDDYKREYIGLVVDGRTDTLLVYFLCRQSEAHWGKDVIFANDGGSCYFNVQFNVATHVYSRLSVNGTS